jgi:hypothetical protein
VSRLGGQNEEYFGSMADERVEAVSRLWRAHVQASFPPRLRGAEVAGVEMILLDADIAGCMGVWLDNGGRLDAGRRAVVASCLGKLNLILPLLVDQEADYYHRLRDIAALVGSELAAADG